jgi:hypothetical protein
MQPLSEASLRTLNLREAIAEESEAKRNLLPREPGWDHLASSPARVERYIETRLRTAWEAAPEVEVAARKPGHGVRPLPYLGLVERIVYRALARSCTASFKAMDRSTDAYLRFLKAPIAYAESRQPRREPQDILSFFLFDTPVSYVVKTDVVAFYQYIDHAILADELLAHGANFDHVQALVQLLSECQGRSFGLPQLLDASDWLSEVYIDRMERQLIRHGLATWRYNDDFRIACDTYPDALGAIEQLDSAARSIGLTLSESKTYTYTLDNYASTSYGLTVTESRQVVEVEDVETVVGDYTDDFNDDDGQSAKLLLSRAKPDQDPDDGIDLKRASTDQVRVLRRALGALTSVADPAAIEYVEDVVNFIPSLTPSVTRYLVAVAQIEEAKVREALTRLTEHVSANDWQHLWWVSAIHETHAIGRLGSTETTESMLLNWCRARRREATSEPVRAAATWALASAGQLSMDEAVADLENGSESLAGYYLEACRLAAGATGSKKDTERLQSIASASTLTDVLTRDHV